MIAATVYVVICSIQFYIGKESVSPENFSIIYGFMMILIALGDIESIIKKYLKNLENKK